MIIMGHRYYTAASWNVNGMNNPVKRSRIMAKIKREKSEIISLQEPHLSKTEHEKLKGVLL